MTTITVKGHELRLIPIKDSYTRRAQQFSNALVALLRSLGVPEDDVSVELERIPLRKAPARISWYMNHQHMYYSYNRCTKFIENLFVVLKVLEREVQAVHDGLKPIEQFIDDFKETPDIAEERKAAREHLGIAADSTDLDLITKRYKTLAKETHPDMPEGSTEKFKALNHAHKVLKRELE